MQDLALAVTNAKVDDRNCASPAQIVILSILTAQRLSPDSASESAGTHFLALRSIRIHQIEQSREYKVDDHHQGNRSHDGRGRRAPNFLGACTGRKALLAARPP